MRLNARTAIVLVTGVLSLAQSREPSFDVVSIKRNVSGNQDIAIDRSRQHVQ